MASVTLRKSPPVWGENARDAIHERLGRVVADEALAKLEGDVMGAGGAGAEDIENGFAVLHAAAGGDWMAQHDLGAVVMLVGAEDELASQAVDRPSGETARDFLHVLLGVTAIHAEGVQLHDFAGVILVDAAFFLADLGNGRSDGAVAILHHLAGDPLGDHLFPGGHGMRDGVGGVVEIVEHGGAFRGGLEQVAEAAPDVGANHVAVIDDLQDAVRAFFSRRC